MSTTPTRDPVPEYTSPALGEPLQSAIHTPMKDPTPEPASPTLGQLLHFAPIMGRKRGRIEMPEEPYVARDISRRN